MMIARQLFVVDRDYGDLLLDLEQAGVAAVASNLHAAPHRR
jgi:hypothetical protein